MNFTEEDDDPLPLYDEGFPSQVTFWIEGVGNLVVGSIGMIINIVALWILFRKQVKDSFREVVSFREWTLLGI